WSIMPNHVHVLIETKSDLRRVLHSWKSYTGKWAFANNKKHELGIAEGAKRFWMSEHWDRFIRNRAHFENTLKYILDNPKNANLEKSNAAYKFTGCVVFNK
ncbi:MAG TPA: transposase, partial [Dysgonamonadaceae bacterium]|nr:transposase [Dysgonamonadaceae bacterium]